MSYRRVIPRDLFNEANLLKCCGKLCILLAKYGPNVGFLEEDVERFRIVQDPSCGNIRISNLTFKIRGTRYILEVPLNSRQPWPLTVLTEDPFPVFTEDGELSEEMVELINGTGEQS